MRYKDPMISAWFDGCEPDVDDSEDTEGNDGCPSLRRCPQLRECPGESRCCPGDWRNE